jgi:hypothetical protein
MAELVSGGHEVVGLTVSFHGLTGEAGRRPTRSGGAATARR